MLRKIAAMINSIEWRYETDTFSVSHGKSHCLLKWLVLFPVNVSSVHNGNKTWQKLLAAQFDENNDN